MAIDVTKAKGKYKTNASRAGSDLVAGYTAVTDKAAKAASDEAQRNFEEAMRDPEVLARRQAKLRALTEEDLNRAMREKGAANYAAGVVAGVDKWATNFEPYAREIDTIVAGLPARTRDPTENVMSRVVPLAAGLSKKKREMR